MKHIITLDGQPVNSMARSKPGVELPVFQFLGPLETGLSGFYSPPHKIKITNCVANAKTTGTSQATLLILRETGMITNDILGRMDMPAHLTRATFNIGVTITSHDRLYIASFSPSNHEDLTVQMFGERV